MREHIDNRRPEEIESDIERTRADFSSTIEAIQNKLTPSELMDQAVDYALSTTPGAFSANLVNSVRDNPIPVALIGVGIAWLMAAGRKQETIPPHMRRQRVTRRAFYPDAESAYDGLPNAQYSSSYESSGSGGGDGMLRRAAAKTSETGRDLKDKASEVGQRISGTASEMTGRVQQAGQEARTRLSESAQSAKVRLSETAESTRMRLSESAQAAQARMNEMSERSRMQYYRTKERVGQMVDEQPLVLGALGIALGAAIGAALPTTRRENELMGQTRDDLLGRAKETALEQAEVVKQSAQRVAEVAKKEVERVKDDITSSAMQGKDRTGSIATGGTDGAPFGGTTPGQQSIH